MTEALTTGLPDTTVDRVRTYARRRRRSVNETVALALDEWLRQTESTYIEFRDTHFDQGIPLAGLVFVDDAPIPSCDFGALVGAAGLTEANHLGNVAYRAGQLLEWDTAKLKVTNTRVADGFIRRRYRKG